MCMLVREQLHCRKLQCGHGICIECFANRAPLPDEDTACTTCDINVNQLEKGLWQAAQLHILLNPPEDGSSRITRIFQARSAVVPDEHIDPALPSGQSMLYPRTHAEWIIAIEGYGLSRDQQNKRWAQLPRTMAE